MHDGPAENEVSFEVSEADIKKAAMVLSQRDMKIILLFVAGLFALVIVVFIAGVASGGKVTESLAVSGIVFGACVAAGGSILLFCATGLPRVYKSRFTAGEFRLTLEPDALISEDAAGVRTKYYFRELSFFREFPDCRLFRIDHKRFLYLPKSAVSSDFFETLKQKINEQLTAQYFKA